MSHVSHEQQNTVWFGISMVLIGVIAGYVLALLTAANPVSAPTPREQPVPTVQAPEQLQDAANVVPVDLSKDHVRGNKNARIALIEYSDMECPYCKAVHPTYKQIVDQYGDKVMWVYRHFPLDFHANAMKQAEASECVAEIGGEDAFWKYVDAIYDRTQSGGQGFPLSELGPLAAEIGVNQGRFQACLDSGKYAPVITEQMQAAKNSGVQGTPGNILYNTKTERGVLFPGARSFASFEEEILKMLNK